MSIDINFEPMTKDTKPGEFKIYSFAVPMLIELPSKDPEDGLVSTPYNEKSLAIFRRHVDEIKKMDVNRGAIFLIFNDDAEFECHLVYTGNEWIEVEA